MGQSFVFNLPQYINCIWWKWSTGHRSDRCEDQIWAYSCDCVLPSPVQCSNHRSDRCEDQIRAYSCEQNMNNEHELKQMSKLMEHLCILTVLSVLKHCPHMSQGLKHCPQMSQWLKQLCFLTYLPELENFPQILQSLGFSKMLIGSAMQ